MGLREYRDRLKIDYRKTFQTPTGEHVLMDLYSHLQGKVSSMPPDGNPTLLAFNEGKRWAWLHIMERLRLDDTDAREMHKQYIDERAREESST